MTLGEGIFYSTFLVIVVWSIYQISRHKKWKAVGKGFVLLAFVFTVIGAGVWGWIAYQARPQLVKEFAGFELGMRPVDVTLAIGEPKGKLAAKEDEDGTYHMFWFHSEGDYDWSTNVYLSFFGDSEDNLTLERICLYSGSGHLLTIGLGDSETAVIEKLGNPTSTSIDNEGLIKILNYTEWLVAYQIKAGKVTRSCATSAPMSFRVEYGPTPSLDEPS